VGQEIIDSFTTGPSCPGVQPPHAFIQLLDALLSVASIVSGLLTRTLSGNRRREFVVSPGNTGGTRGRGGSSQTYVLQRLCFPRSRIRVCCSRNTVSGGAGGENPRPLAYSGWSPIPVPVHGIGDAGVARAFLLTGRRVRVQSPDQHKTATTIHPPLATPV